MSTNPVVQKKPDILHVVEYQKFIPPFIAFIDKHLDVARHHFLFINNGDKYISQGDELVLPNRGKNKKLIIFWFFLKDAYRVKKIILHGLFSSRLIFLLFLQPWLLNKCYWIIWGGDLYTYMLDEKSLKWHLKEFFRRFIIPRLGHLVTYIKGDVDLAHEWYGAKGAYHDCLIYTSNIFNWNEVAPARNEVLNILAGNSADEGNNHFEIFEKIKLKAGHDCCVICPLSYGDKEYANKVVRAGYQYFGERFKPILKFLDKHEYSKILSSVDIAIFNHNRQQAMGNIIELIGMGKKVYLRKNISSRKTLEDMGVKLFDISIFDPAPISEKDAISNIRIIRENFSEVKLLNQLRNLFS